MRVGTKREILYLFQEGLERRRLLRKFLVVPSRCRERWQSQDVGQVDARIGFRAVDEGVEVEDLRKKNHAVQIDRFLLFEYLCQHGRTRSSIAFAEDEFGRVPSTIFGDEAGNEASKGAPVFIHTPESLLGILADKPAEPRAWRVNEYEIADVEQGIRVVDQLVRRRRQVLVSRSDHVLGTKGSHVQPDGGATRATVVKERHWPLLGLRVFLKICHV